MNKVLGLLIVLGVSIIASNADPISIAQQQEVIVTKQQVNLERSKRAKPAAIKEEEIADIKRVLDEEGVAATYVIEKQSFREAPVYLVSKTVKNKPKEEFVLKKFVSEAKAIESENLADSLRNGDLRVPTVKSKQKGEYLIMNKISGTFFQVSKPNGLVFINDIHDEDVARKVMRAFIAAVKARMTDIQGFYNENGHGGGQEPIQFIDLHRQNPRVGMPTEITKLVEKFKLEKEYDLAFPPADRL